MNEDKKVKEKILEKSIEAFLSKGFRGTTTKEITSAAGVAKGTLYWHFKSKDEILDAILEKFLKEFVGGISDTVANCSENFVGKFKAFFKFGSEFSRDNLELMLVYQTLLGEIVGSKSKAEMKMKVIQNRYDHLVQTLLDEGKREGVISEDVDTYIHARIMTAALVGSYLQWYLNAGSYDSEYVRLYAMTIRRTLLKWVGVEIDR